MSLVRRWGLPALVLGLAALGAAPARAWAADEGPASVDSKAVDALVHKTLREVINEGADLYNAQGKFQNAERDFSGCYRLYEGALMATKPLLSNHPDLQKAIDDGLATAATTAQTERRAFVLRAVIDKIREATNPNPVAVKPPPEKETTAAGKAVGAEKGKLTLSVGGEDKSFTVPETAKVTIDGKDGLLEDIKKDSNVTVTSKGDIVAKVDVKSPAAPPPPPPPPPAKETKVAGKVAKVEKGTLTLKDDEGKEKSFTVPATAKVTIDGKDGLLDDVKSDSAVTVTSKGDEVTKVDVKAAAAPPPPPPPPEAKTLWDRLGGDVGVAKVVDDFVNTAGKDPKVNFWRDPTKVPSKEEVADLKKHIVAFVSSVTGGPLKYEGKSMKEVHKGMKITSEEFDANAADLKDALEKNGAKPDDVKAVMALVATTRKDIVEDKAAPPPPPPPPPPDKDKPAPPDKDKPAPPDKDKPPPPDKDKPAPPDKDKPPPPPPPDKDKPPPPPPPDKDKPAPPDKDKPAPPPPEKDKPAPPPPPEKDKPAAPPAETSNVSGAVTYKGKPLTNCVVTFLSSDGSTTAQADLAADGTYKLEKVKLGVYTVAVAPGTIANDPTKPVPLAAVPKKFTDPKTSSLTVEVKKGEQTLDFDLQ